MSATLSGDDALRAKFHKMSYAVKGQSLVRAAHAGALPIANDAKAHAPVLTGTLRRSIHTIAEHVGANQASVDIGTDVVYAARIEFGFVGADSLGRNYHQGARPYLRPALESGRGPAEREMADTMTALIMAAVG